MAIPGGDRVVEIREADLLHLLSCAMYYNSRLPYGMVPGQVWAVLSAEGREWLMVAEGGRSVQAGMADLARLRAEHGEVKGSVMFLTGLSSEEIDLVGGVGGTGNEGEGGPRSHGEPGSADAGDPSCSGGSEG